MTHCEQCKLECRPENAAKKCELLIGTVTDRGTESRAEQTERQLFADFAKYIAAIWNRQYMLGKTLQRLFSVFASNLTRQKPVHNTHLHQDSMRKFMLQL